MRLKVFWMEDMVFLQWYGLLWWMQSMWDFFGSMSTSAGGSFKCM